MRDAVTVAADVFVAVAEGYVDDDEDDDVVDDDGDAVVVDFGIVVNEYWQWEVYFCHRSCYYCL